LQDASNTGATKEVFDMIELTDAELEQVSGGKVTTTTTVVKVPGPTDFIVTTATNPGGGTPVGHQSTTEVKNRDA
jgi:bacteriocin-like protein